MHCSPNHLAAKYLFASLACALLFVGCGAPHTHPHPHPHDEETPHAHDEETPHAHDEETTSDVVMPCVAPGAPNAETCGYVVNGCCYATAALACHVAGCGEDTCTILESFPAQVRCP